VRDGEGHTLGWLGELHPSVAREWDLESAAAFEIDVDHIAERGAADQSYRDLSSFPPVVQDIAIVLPEDVPAAEVVGAVRSAAGLLLDRIELFDVYHGEQVGPGNKSLALRLEFRSPERTLTDEDVAAARSEIERELEAIGGRLRA
jgi:phenylalanyl-tRNA synthetase beta chain